ncbi:DUF4211 domain-containing protein [Mycena kentingensis (nom. inval.)]|nr:DUF4211 domain-containing protein [Mycena kentingensis (nom. inval.)]
MSLPQRRSPQMEVFIIRPDGFNPDDYLPALRNSKRKATKAGARDRHNSTRNMPSSSRSRRRSPDPAPRRQRHRTVHREEDAGDESEDARPANPRAHRAISRLKQNKQDLYEKLRERRKNRGQGRPAPRVIPQYEYGSASEHDSLFDSDPDEEKEDEEFIAEDGPEQVVLPPEYQAPDSQREQVSKIIQLFVQIAAYPPLERARRMQQYMQDDYFERPLTALRKRMSGLATAITTQTIAPVLRRIMKYPELTTPDTPEPGTIECTICSKKGRCDRLALSGFPYENPGFEERQQTLRTYTYFAGQFCAKRIKAFHALTHWEYHLFAAVKNEIDELHEIKHSRRMVDVDDRARPLTLQQRGAPTDLTDADAIFRWLDEVRGFVKLRHEKIRDIIKQAENVERQVKAGHRD